ncbi:MAG: UDP-N-acetylmuramoyl-tripeptide--D-alanyl-D-alanine ligase [Mariprofundaceae bacterium]
MSAAALQLCTTGHWHGASPDLISGVSTDTRSLCQGDAFLALRGPNFNGHTFASEAVRAGASLLIGDAAGVRGWQDFSVPKLEVADTQQAFAAIAGEWRAQLSAKVVGITGSYGKTTLRSMLQHVLQKEGVRVSATRANDNNLIGVPQTLLAIDADAEVALVECGVSERGEMEQLAAMVQPDVAVIIGVSAAHAEGLGGVADIAKEKAILLDYRAEKGHSILGYGIATWLSDGAIDNTVLDMDVEDSRIVRWHMDGRKITLMRAGESASFDVPLPAKHWAQDAALAATVLACLGITSLQSIAAALADWQAVSGRMHCVDGHGGCVILDDSYNANPASMAAALDTLRKMSGRRIAVLGDMAELGEDAPRLHAELDIHGIDAVIVVGEQMQALALQHSGIEHVNNAGQALITLRDMDLGVGDVLLVKGSRCMQMEKIVNGLTGDSDAV